jgi:hypothetical protein
MIFGKSFPLLLRLTTSFIQFFFLNPVVHSWSDVLQHKGLLKSTQKFRYNINAILMIISLDHGAELYNIVQTI